MALTFFCECCINEFPEVLSEVHHKSPREYGKPSFCDDIDDAVNLTKICEHCHSLVHKVATMIIKGKEPETLILAVFGSNPVGADNLRELAKIIVAAHANRTVESHREVQSVQVPLSFEFYNLHVKAAAKACKQSVAEYMANAVIEKTLRINGHEASLALDKIESGQSLMRTTANSFQARERRR